MRPIGDVFLDRQDKVIDKLKQDSRYLELEKIIRETEREIRNSGQAVSELFSKYDNAIIHQNAITENAMYMAGLKDGIGIDKLREMGRKHD